MNTDTEKMLAPIKKSKEFQNWRDSHAAEMKKALAQRQRAAAFAEIIAEARATVEDPLAEPRKQMRARGDIEAAEAEQQACIDRATDIEGGAIHAGSAGEAVVTKLANHLAAAAAKEHGELSEALARLSHQHDIKLEAPSIMQLRPQRLLARFTGGDLDQQRIAVWHALVQD